VLEREIKGEGSVLRRVDMRYIVLLEYRRVRYLVMGLERRKVRVLRERSGRGMRGLE